MLKQQDIILRTEEEYHLINSVKTMIDDIHERGTFFSLPLKSLELIRRFNKFYSILRETGNPSESDLHQLMVISRNLEAEILRNS